MARILCALSGGVDSSVTALLLQRAGHDVTCVFMRTGSARPTRPAPPPRPPGAKKSCCSASDAHDARRVADQLGLPFYAIDYAKEFGRIIDGFVSEYRQGRTPSPCVLCNQDLKFGHLFELAEALGCEEVATGHYARREGDALLRAVDRSKDQSYFLFGVERAKLPRVRFPLGGMSKDEVRALAHEAGLPDGGQAESMEICFVPGGDYRQLLEEHGALTPGRFVDRDGRELGRHEGFEGYTVGSAGVCPRSERRTTCSRSGRPTPRWCSARAKRSARAAAASRACAG
jgi:tRNA-specific 2-thiouridylase